jgi:hypothetical protein
VLSALFGGVCFATEHAKLNSIAASVAAACFASAFIVGAVGLLAELNRTTSRERR